MDQTFDIRPLTATPETRAQLCDIHVGVVAGGASVSFMHPVAETDAIAFWDDALAAAARGDKVVLGAWIGDLLVGTVTLVLAFPPNQPHRGEIAKLMTRPGHTGTGIASALMAEAEGIAAANGRTLLALDTATDGGAGALYERLGYTLAGEIPDFALKPHGGLSGTLVYWKRLTVAPHHSG